MPLDTQAIEGTMPTPLNWHTLVTTWDMPVVPAMLIGVAAVAYLWASRRADGWRARETVAFLAGLGVTLVAVGGSVNAYSDVLFYMHMVQHLLLIMVVPALLVLGKPLELLRRTATGRTRRVLAGAARSRVVAVLTHPAVSFVYYAAVVVGTHLTSFQQSALTQPWVQALEEALYLSSGYLLLLPVLGSEPIRRTMSHLMRLVSLFAAMVVDTVVGVTLMMTPYMPFPAYGEVERDWGPSLIDDLHWGGATMWVIGDLLMAVLAVIVITRWVNTPGGMRDLGPWLESARRSALGQPDREVGGADIDDDEEALRAYNAMLARLKRGERG